MNDVVDEFIGKRFGRLIVVADSGLRSRDGNKLWFCRCDCGRLKTLPRGSLERGNTQSCGCLRSERLRARNRARGTHGETANGTRSPEYLAWESMLQRCYNSEHAAYADYGGRGITVHPAWRNEYLAFLRDVGRRPSPRHSIDRYPDNDGSYVPGNVRWATRREQAQNRRSARDPLTIDGITKPISEWAREVDVPYGRIFKRLQQGHDAKSAVFTPHRGEIVAEIQNGVVSFTADVREIGSGGRTITVPMMVVRRLEEEKWDCENVEVSIARCTPFRGAIQVGARSSSRLYLPKKACGKLRMGSSITVELRK